MNIILSFLAIIACIINHVVHSQVIQDGNCPEVKVKEDFNIDEYMGTWYENVKYPARFEANGKCMYAIYTKLDNGTVAVGNTKIDKDTGIKSTSHGLADVKEPGKLLVTFFNSKVPAQNTDPNYWILGTNYKDYSIVFYCRVLPNNQNAQLLWILTRERNPNQSVIEDAYKIIDENKLIRNHFTKTEQTNCPEN